MLFGEIYCDFDEQDEQKYSRNIQSDIYFIGPALSFQLRRTIYKTLQNAQRVCNRGTLLRCIYKATKLCDF